MKYKLGSLSLFFFGLILVIGCGGKEGFGNAERSEKLGRFSTAISQYEDFWKLNSRSKKAPEALYRIGEIYRTVIVDYEKARKTFHDIIEWYPASDWAKKSELAIMNCPDYFPFEKGKRTLVDSMSGGANARMVESQEIDKEDPSRLMVKRETLAGDQKVGEIENEYEKKAGELREKQKGGSFSTVLLRFPAEKGRKWETLRNNKRISYEVESLNESLQVKAGTFTACLKLLEKDLNRPDSARVQYFAPGTGLVLVSQSSRNQETRVMELLSFEKK